MQALPFVRILAFDQNAAFKRVLSMARSTRGRIRLRSREHSAPSATALLRHLPELYAARTLEAFADAAFRLLHATVPCDCVSVFYPGAGDRMLQERDSLGREYGPEFTARHAELTPAIRIAMANPGIKLLPTRTGLPEPEEQLRQSAFYREIMQVQGWRHAVALCFWDEPPTFPVLVFTVKRGEGAADFSDQNLAALKGVHGFLAPAVDRMLERAAANSICDAMASSLRHRPGAVIVLDSRLGIIRSSPGADRLCARLAEPMRGRINRSARALSVPPALLEACREMREERLRLLRKSPAHVPPLVRQASIPHALEVSVTITMFCEQSSGLMEQSFVVEIDEAGGDRTPDERRSLLAVPPTITTAERDVALVLAEGLSNQEIADRLGKSVHAVKFLLHRVYRKTGVTSRAGLVALLRSHPSIESRRS